MSQECRCQQASPHERQHLANIVWQVSKILDHSERALVGLLAGYFVQALQEGFLEGATGAPRVISRGCLIIIAVLLVGL